MPRDGYTGIRVVRRERARARRSCRSRGAAPPRGPPPSRVRDAERGAGDEQCRAASSPIAMPRDRELDRRNRHGADPARHCLHAVGNPTCSPPRSGWPAPGIRSRRRRVGDHRDPRPGQAMNVFVLGLDEWRASACARSATRWARAGNSRNDLVFDGCVLPEHVRLGLGPCALYGGPTTYACGEPREVGAGSPHAWRARLRLVGPVEQRPHAQPIGQNGGILGETPSAHGRDGGEAETGENAGPIVSALDVARIHDV